MNLFFVGLGPSLFDVDNLLLGEDDGGVCVVGALQLHAVAHAQASGRHVTYARWEGFACRQ